MFILDVVALFFAGLLVGNEVAIAAFVHPVLWRQTDEVHVAGAAGLARVLGRAMPFWYALVAVLTLCLVFVNHGRAGGWSPWLAGSAGVWIATILLTVSALVPINNRVAGWTNESRPANWREDRTRWDRLHRWRVVLLAVAFVLLIVGVLLRR